MLTLITGPDAFLARGEITRLRSVHDPDGLNTTALDGKTASVDEISAALGTPAFFGASRLIIVSDLMARSAKSAVTSEDDDEAPPGRSSVVDWTRIFGSIQAGNIAVFVDRDLRAIPAAVKRALPGHATIVECEPPRGSELVNWIKQRAVHAKSTISDIDARMLAELLCPGTWTSKPNNPAYDRPPDLELFANEIEKLALYADRGTIERTHIVDMIAAGQQDRLFPLIDAVVAGDSATSVRELSTAMSRGDEASRISAQLGQQAELMAALASAGQTDPVEVGKALGLSNPNRMLAVSKSLRRFQGRPGTLLAAVLEIERQFKTGVLRQPVDQVYSLVERITRLAHSTRQGGT